ncbi:hypothetical protein EMIHUDRAFT_442460 [Emiliania huxleyi CCMP1516]|uniref:DAGKc domain-containing protein n=2 Tax=Emiliania huxleyi TaxID=2903 RepID=A0A0D3K4F7_EMIH1|nr:hypothetical protein EMIHUDRAFT_435737 [Emiliania huxleyi CCMP1516]XP_005783071.1 hypothetical protein EMIHUDRAFT_442460 [Emiliania huxleyi CCMP1516]EOD20916.1 hypothetical protein EMIHUDRAFT_435737 [Emiliania huxleyi CCMP1516]EOD30642.1 hypothetical protein EMIHUDRAFT_442460 [Emiliania huxleyi CCMP1516]|eukprot:XP_005773345.1 hypothetical protein EMIHUDRAFT_435737 [Emiliania huxleyi CCMP1516]
MSRPVAAARPYKETIDSKSPDVRRTRVNEAISRGRERRAAAAAAAEEEEGPSGLSALLCCCLPGGTGNALLSEVAMTASAMRGPPPLELLPGYANESGSGRDPPTSGWLEVVNKSERDGEVIAVLAGANVVELLRCKVGSLLLLDEALRNGVMEDQTVVSAEIGPSVDTLEVALFTKPRLPTADAVRSGVVRDNFAEVTAYTCRCAGRNVLLKYKRGALEVQRGGGGGLAAFGVGKRKAVGSNIDMKTNVESLEQAALP